MDNIAELPGMWINYLGHFHYKLEKLKSSILGSIFSVVLSFKHPTWWLKVPLGTNSLYGKFGVDMPSGSFTIHKYVHFSGQKHSLIIKDSKFNMLLH